MAGPSGGSENEIRCKGELNTGKKKGFPCRGLLVAKNGNIACHNCGGRYPLLDVLGDAIERGIVTKESARLVLETTDRGEKIMEQGTQKTPGMVSVLARILLPTGQPGQERYFSIILGEYQSPEQAQLNKGYIQESLNILRRQGGLQIIDVLLRKHDFDDDKFPRIPHTASLPIKFIKVGEDLILEDFVE